MYTITSGNTTGKEAISLKCQSCEACGKPIEVADDGTKLCLPVIIGTEGGDSRHCWCICDDCKQDFIKRSAKVLEELKETN